MGVQFEQLKGWQMRYFGQFWGEFAADYPSAQDQPPFPDIVEGGPRLENAPGGGTAQGFVCFIDLG